ncbi:AfsR/SARP family transcriptional regulator [Actinosynnema sp. NPDC047251]|uniref:Transcriptional regulator, AraC family n=1 Tax=Saccharothrix espanaensis (strain ATCC 51144 / DSM 44229 / JCM 9112 / NBRC 15066 / NRRL 15764) TaxID=1179773 RepID=K0K9J7_SACES|nr:AfsR/SARP family transcriptional regulator [Saccharothrix espanaensis]CCH33298.1 Transcriptional regulator, AraC family [Saccharothrix espanaensis DSM 44229]
MAVEIRLLGTVEAVLGGRRTDLGHARQRCVLVALAVEVNQPVAFDRLVTRVWGDRPPRRPRAALYGYLYRLRRVLADAEGVALVRHTGCYELVADPDAVDLRRFERLADAARRAGSDAERLALFDRAARLWRGEPFAGLDTPWLSATRAAVEQQRYLAEAERTDTALRLGLGAGELARLTARAADHPLDERVAAQLLLALHRTGRTGEALARYQLVRRLLADELGTDPGPALRAAHRQLLQPPADPPTPVHRSPVDAAGRS